MVNYSLSKVMSLLAGGKATFGFGQFKDTLPSTSKFSDANGLKVETYKDSIKIIYSTLSLN